MANFYSAALMAVEKITFCQFGNGIPKLKKLHFWVEWQLELMEFWELHFTPWTIT
jgi:hypothetical protein